MNLISSNQTSIPESEAADQLCSACDRVNLFSLFTGPRYFSGDGYKHREMTSLGTLADVLANASCPLCRLIRKDVYDIPIEYQQVWPKQLRDIDVSQVAVSMCLTRVDYHEELEYFDSKTKDMVATRLEIRVTPMEGLSDEDKDLILHYHRGNGIQLLSPESVDSERPLLNGYRYTNMDNNLELLKKWLDGCVEKHGSEMTETARCRRYFHNASSTYGIRLIDVEHRKVVESDPESVEYAALSYVWESAGQTKRQDSISSSSLPEKVPKVIEDALLVCKRLAIPYLWVDRYCIDQNDVSRKAYEIEGMGYRYHYAKLVLIAALERDIDDEGEVGLFPVSNISNTAITQRVETVQGRRYITCLPSIITQIHRTKWHQRGWTMQEGQLANRCAFFGKYDISFMCGSGHWRETFHSGPYGHGEISGIDTSCQGYYTLSWLRWVKDDCWSFSQYNSLLMSYTGRKLSFESDRLNAITGCLNFITEVKGVKFTYGIPLVDFHYALLWSGSYDRPREGFPSWAWAGWHCLQQSHMLYPMTSSTCSLNDDGNGNLLIKGPISQDIEVQGVIVALAERPHRTNKCAHRYANISLPSHKTDSVLQITSEVAQFSIDILPGTPKTRPKWSPAERLDVPHGFDSTSDTDLEWDLTSEYWTPHERLRLRDVSGNTYKNNYPRWFDHWPPFMLLFGHTLRGETIDWILTDGIQLILILELDMIEGDESLKPFNLVFCLGLDRRAPLAKRCGIFCFSKEIWEKACPKMETVALG